tara:strand:+ start:291 stop:1553 length:1263 start_codon:yes stop_codon:yes gene_type:complete
MENWGLSEWLHWQEGLNPKEIDLNLKRVGEVASRLDIRPPVNRTFLIAGTNGKGTTLALIEDILIYKGLKVGSYTSPHLINYNERICINKLPIGDSKLIDAFKFIESIRNEVPLTYFEFGTLAAFKILNDLNCQAWLVEVGLGGRLDATNIINPSISIITNVDYDHQEWLGETLEEIAREKAGIIATDTPSIFADSQVPKSIKQIAFEKKSHLHLLDRDFSWSSNCESSEWRGKDAVINSIMTPSDWAEGENSDLAAALMAIEILDSFLLPTTKELNHILKEFSVSGRFEIIEKKQTWILDVAHNPHAAVNLKKRLESLHPYKKITAIFSMMQDKDVIGIVEVLDDLVDHWIVCEMNSPRSHTAQTLQKKLTDFGIRNVTVESGLDEAFSNIKNHSKKNDRILVTGSFEIVGPAKIWLDS